MTFLKGSVRILRPVRRNRLSCPPGTFGNVRCLAGWLLIFLLLVFSSSSFAQQNILLTADGSTRDGRYLIKSMGKELAKNPGCLQLTEQSESAQYILTLQFSKPPWAQSVLLSQPATLIGTLTDRQNKILGTYSAGPKAFHFKASVQNQIAKQVKEKLCSGRESSRRE